MTYTEKELDQFLHGISLSLLSKKSAQHWRYDEETAKEIEWLEVLERKVRADKADRKTEPTSSKMEQVETMSCARCKHRPIGAMMCEESCHYEPKDEPQPDCAVVTDTSYQVLDGWQTREKPKTTDCPWK